MRRAQGCKHAGCRRRQERRSSPSDSFNSKHFTNSHEAQLYPNPLGVNVSGVFLHTIGVSESLRLFRALFLVVYRDSDTDTRRSHTGYILMMNGSPISWKSRRQDNVSLSTSEAEFVAASQAGQEAIYLRETLAYFGFLKLKPLICTKTTLIVLR